MLFGAGEGVYMLGACVLMVLGAERWLLAALAPGVLGSAVFLALGRPPSLDHAAWAAARRHRRLLALAAGDRVHPDAGASGSHPVPGLPPSCAAHCLPWRSGWSRPGCWPSLSPSGPHGHGGVNVGALLAALPLSLSMGAAEWSLLWYRRRTQRLLRETTQTCGRSPSGRGSRCSPRCCSTWPSRSC